MARILIIDDYPDLLSVMKIYLKKKGFTIDTCQTSEEVFSKIYSFGPDLIILDVFLNAESGKSLCKKIKQIDSLCHIPVILFSAHMFPLEYLKDRMYDDFLQKPFDVAELLDKIDKHLNPHVAS